MAGSSESASSTSVALPPGLETRETRDVRLRRPALTRAREVPVQKSSVQPCTNMIRRSTVTDRMRQLPRAARLRIKSLISSRRECTSRTRRITSETTGFAGGSLMGDRTATRYRETSVRR
ncbi:hypothetical protein C9J85_10005 [Haloferax sp. wsp5]|nr:hypothetical protein C9J85_10005 [Haloferax sp. wsp5]